MEGAFKFGNKKLKLDECFANLRPVELKATADVETEATAMAAFSRSKKFKQRKSPWSSNNNDEETRSCYYCGAKGHIKANCNERKADLKEFEEQKLQGEEA